MSLAMKMVCNKCGFEFENDGCDLFYIDPETNEIFDHRIMLREDDPSEYAEIKGETRDTFCPHCNKNIKLYLITDFNDYGEDEAISIVEDALRKRPDNIKLSARQKHRYFLSTIFEIEIKDMVENKIIKIYDVDDFNSKEEAVEIAKKEFKEFVDDLSNYDIDDLHSDPNYLYIVKIQTDSYEETRCPECHSNIPSRIEPYQNCPKCDGELELVSTMLLDGV